MSGKSGSVLDGPIVYVDIETNGLNHVRGRVIEVAAIRVEAGKVTKRFSSLVDPETELPRFITNLTGITANDLAGAPTFHQIADELYDTLDGAVFIAHNVRFDYSFLKQEFKRLNRSFLPKQLCTARLSRALFPEHRSHKLQSLIDRYGFTFTDRHRAYDDAAVLRQFIEYIRTNVAVEVVEAAIARQIRQPAIPKSLDPDFVKDLPTGPGVYLFQDDAGRTLYVGKSINIKKRVLQHFGADHSDGKEFKIAQTVKHIETRQTEGELSALLLESQLVKELQPLYNRQLRRLEKLIAIKESTDDTGYVTLSLEEATAEEALTGRTTVATYPRRSAAKRSLEDLLRQYDLCPKLMGLEKSKGACFWYQLGKCRGACVGDEPAMNYNVRLHTAFGGRKIESWPFNGPVLVQESDNSGLVVDDWCVLAEISQQPDCEPTVTSRAKTFDLDTYKILRSFLAHKVAGLRIRPMGQAHLEQFGLS